SPPKWSGSSRSCRAWWWASTRALMANAAMLRRRFTTTIPPSDWTIQLREISPSVPWLSPTSWSPSRGAVLWLWSRLRPVERADDDDLVDAQKRLQALRTIRGSKNFEPLTVSFKRIRKILEKSNNKAPGAVQPELFENEAERELFGAARETASKVQADKRTGN